MQPVIEAAPPVPLVAEDPTAPPLLPVEAVPPPAAAPVEEAAAAGAIVDAGGTVAPSAVGPVMPLGGLGGIPTPVGVVPPISFSGAMPDIGLPLPSALPIPTDLVCEGTAWSAKQWGAAPKAELRPGSRRPDW